MKNTVVEIMDYGAAYKGNFMFSVLALADELEKYGVETVFVFPKRAKNREWAMKLPDEGRTVFYLSDSLSENIKILKSIFKKYNVRAVHSHFIDSKMYLPLKAVNMFKKVPHYFHAHSIAKQNKNNLKTKLRRYLLGAEKIICVGDSVKKSYEKLGFGNCITVKNSICFSRLDEYCDVREMLSADGKYSVLMFGYDFRIKGIDTAIEALHKYDKNHDITLCVCVASHFDRAEEYVKNRFGEIPGWIKLLPPRGDVASYMRSADVFLSASRTEGMAYAVLEAAYCSVPIVLSDITQHTELSLPDVRTFPVENGELLYEALVKTLNSEKTDENSRFVKKEFSMDVWLSKTATLLTEKI